MIKMVIGLVQVMDQIQIVIKKRFGDDITFSVIGLAGKFSTEAEYRDAIKNNKTTFDSRTKEEKDQEINNAKDRVKEKRSIRKHIESFNDFKKIETSIKL